MTLHQNTEMVFDILRRLVLAEQTMEWRQTHTDLDKYRQMINADQKLLTLGTSYLWCPSEIAPRILGEIQDRLRSKFF